MKPLQITVLMGGTSKEREISLQSGREVVKALLAAGAHVAEVDVQDASFHLPANTDVAFIALHGTFGEDGQVQRILEERGVAYTGSKPEASARAFNKTTAKQAFRAAGIPTPKAAYSPPLVAKPARQGSSVGVTVVRHESELAGALAEAKRYDENVIIEQFIEGREFTVGILGGRALPVIEIRTNRRFFDYEAKYTPGEADEICPALINAMTASQIQHWARRAHECLGCRDFSRVDVMWNGKGDFFVLEVNTIPGLTPNSLLPKAARAAGMSMEALCVRIVEMALERRLERVVA
jgi:D-alanine-D-alanine ligase